MRSIRAKAFVAFAVCLLLAGCSSSPAATLYGPSGQQFTVAFPSTPKSEINTKDLLASAPKGSKVYAYSVSPDSNIFSNSAPTPRPPTYAVALFVSPSTTFGSEFVGSFAHIPGAKR